jgi:LPS sulfotransferase NodH
VQRAPGKRIRHAFRVAREYSLHATGLRRPPEKRFVILSRARSGSTLLASLLNSVPNMHCDGEILRHPLPFPERYIHARSAAKACSAYGFKVLIGQVRKPDRFHDPENLIRRLHGDGFSVVHLRRRDRLAAAVSVIRALRFGFHERTTQNQKTQREPMAIDFEKLTERFERIELYEQYATQLLQGVPHTEVIYEADLEDQQRHQSTVDRLCESLGIPSGPVESRFQRLATRPLRETVLNFDELDERMRGTKWAALFDPHR